MLDLGGSIKDIAEVIGVLPAGDVPAAWFCSLNPEVLSAYAQYQSASAIWRARMDELTMLSEFPTTLKLSTLGGDSLLGLIPWEGMTTPPRWWRLDKEGLLVPRRRTRAEKASQVNTLWEQLRTIPRAVDFLPGLPNTLFIGNQAYAVHIRKPAQAVLVFLAADPDVAYPPFEVGPQWSRLKMSTWWALKERQLVPPPGPEWWTPELG